MKANNKQQAANYLTEALVHVSDWLVSTFEYSFYIYLNIKKNCLCVLFTKPNSGLLKEKSSRLFLILSIVDSQLLMAKAC